MNACHRIPGLSLLLAVAVSLAAGVQAAAPATELADLFDPRIEPIFEHLTVDEGLPENSVRAMIQDRHGFLWLGTQNGLVRYDGAAMAIFLPDPRDSTSLGGRTIDALYEARDGTIWIGTLLRGLWRYDPTGGGFTAIDGGRGPELEAGAFHVADIAEDADGRLWLATEHGLASLEPGDGIMAWPDLPAADPGLSVAAPYTSVLVDDRGRVWSGTEGEGVLRLDPTGDRPRWFRPDPERPRTLPHLTVRDISQGPDGRIWLATDAGLALWSDTSGDFQVFRDAGLELRADQVLISIAHDPRGVIWLGTLAGVYVFEPAGARFRLFEHAAARPTTPVNGPVLSVLVDRSGLLWAGTWRAGLNKTNPAVGQFRVQTFTMAAGPPRGASVEALLLDRRGDLYVGLSNIPRGFGQGRVMRRSGLAGVYQGLPVVAEDGETMASVVGFAEGPDGTVWVATWRGLWRIVDSHVERAPTGPGPEGALLRRSAVKSVAHDSRGRIWMATATGVYRLDPGGGRPAHFRHDPDDPASVGTDNLVTIHVDAADRVWVGGDVRGLNLFLGDDQGFRRFFEPENGLETIGAIHETDDGTLWLGTYSGLVRFDPATGETRVIGRREGLPSEEVTAILPDRHGRLWLSTGYGLAAYDPARGTVQAFDRRDGLPDNDAMFARVIDRDGTFRFGGNRGMVSFDPDLFAISTYQPRVVITGIELSDRPLEVGGESPLAVVPHLAEGLRLSHDQNDLGFAFAALDYARPAGIRYFYMLEGADEDWRVPGTEHRAGYINLAPGDYRFRVRGSNRDGIISPHEAAIAIRIDRPWWRTTWALALYGLTAVLLAVGVYRQLTLRERMRARFALQRAEAEKLQEIDQLKTRFLTNITHEFRTPLTLIKVPLMDLKEKWEGAPTDRLDTMIRNAGRLEQLIDQLLDLSRLEAGKLPLQWQHGDYVSFLVLYAAAFESLAAQRDVEFVVQVPDEGGTAWYDPDLLQKLLGNLLSNAIKHTPDGGRIFVVLAAGSERPLQPRHVTGDPVPARELVIAVTNSGSYIPAEDHDRVFERFYQASTASGSGVGLSLVKELTEWLGGRIEVASDVERGTCFTVTVPVFLEHPEGLATVAAVEVPTAASVETAEAEDDEEEEGDGLPRILVVEDNRDLRQLIAEDLSATCRVLQAADGEAGLELAIAEIPDLVLSDVMMPGMDGMELCRCLKEDERTSHVPVILLTARSESASRHEGLRLGADDYLAKPFDAKELRLRIRNLIEQRRQLAERYERKLAVLSPDVMPVTSADERFIVQLREIIDGNLDDPDFKINELCHEVGMSRSQLHRKLKAVTGKSTSDFVRTHRLQRAAQLFEGGYGNVTEVAYAVGFRNLSYFARSYRELYGVLPSEVLRGEGGDPGPEA